MFDVEKQVLHRGVCYRALTVKDDAKVATVEAVPVDGALGAAADDGVRHRNQTGLTSSWAKQVSK